MGRLRLLCLTMWLLCAVAPYADAQADSLPDTPGAAAPDDMEEVVVSGERKGPRMWRISKGEHVLWLLGTPGVLPKGVTWDAQDVEAVLQESQLVLSDVRVEATPGVISLISLYRQYRRTIRLPDQQTLRDWLTPELYQRYHVLKQRYAPKEDWDDFRPLYVAQQLWRRAREQQGMQERVDVQRAVLKLAKQHRVKTQELEINVEKPAKTAHGVLDELAEIPREREVACFDATLTTLQDDVDVLKARADAWALGDVARLRQLQTGERQACWQALQSAPSVQQLNRQSSEYWYRNAVQALQAHASTLALRSMNQLLGEQDVLARFRADGYQVEGP